MSTMLDGIAHAFGRRAQHASCAQPIGAVVQNLYADLSGPQRRIFGVESLQGTTPRLLIRPRLLKLREIRLRTVGF